MEFEGLIRYILCGLYSKILHTHQYDMYYILNQNIFTDINQKKIIFNIILVRNGGKVVMHREALVIIHTNINRYLNPLLSQIGQKSKKIITLIPLLKLGKLSLSNKQIVIHMEVYYTK